jgi:hypothetical protein
MKKGSKIIGKSGLVLIILVLLSLLIVLGVKYKARLGIRDLVGIMIKKQEVLSRMRINLLKSVEAEKSAVMAETDRTSQAFADQSRQAADAVEQERQELTALIQKDPSDQEMKLLGEFDRCWKAFRKTDRELLMFAVQNTNLKAASLSFIQGGEALKRLEEALNRLKRVGPVDKATLQIDQLICRTLAAGLKIQYLQAPHIAAVSDQQMDKIEREIKQNEETARDSLVGLKGLLPEAKQADWQKAKIAFDHLVDITAQVIHLSRQNTNIKSFELSLGRKSKQTAQCEEILTSLQEAVRNRSFKATR